LSGLAGAAGIKSPDEIYVAVIKSRSVADALIARFSLKDKLEAETLHATYAALNQIVRVSSDKKSSLIAIEVDSKDPAFAASLANAHVDELRKVLAKLAVTDAQQKRVFFEQQMLQAKEALIAAELATKQAQERGGLVSIDAQTQSVISAVAQIRGQIVAKEVQLQAMRPYAGPENPELRKVLSELNSLRAQLGKLETGSGQTSTVDAEKTQAVANVRLYRELKYQEAVYTSLLQQFQLARADEARDAPLIQQIDVAVAPDYKSKPKRALIVLMALLAGLFLSTIFVFVRKAFQQAHSLEKPGESRFQKLFDAWKLRRS
jgi:tyrosine-protein kinase Etk/Wzc